MKIDSGKVEISLEDPVEKRELEHFLKTKGHFADYVFNSEVVRIAPARLFELIIENLENGEEEFNKLIRSYFRDSTRSDKVIKGARTLSEKFSNLRDELKDPSNFIALLGIAATLYK